MDDLTSICERLRHSLCRTFLDTKTEAAFHDSVHLAAKSCCTDVIREYRISKRDRFDLWLPFSGTVIEVKLKPKLLPLVRQLQRYASHEVVKGMILVSATVPPGFPESVALKPVFNIACWKYLLQ